MDNFIELSFEDWVEQYKPITNHIDKNASFQDEDGNGLMFETYGDEVEFVKSQSLTKFGCMVMAMMVPPISGLAGDL